MYAIRSYYVHQDIKDGFRRLILMMSADSVDNVVSFTIFFRKITANDGMRALHFVVNRLANVMQQAGTFGFFDIQTKLRRHDPAEESHLQGVLKDILTVASYNFV